MTTQEIATRLVELCREGKYEQVYQELYHPRAKSIEPANDYGLESVEGLENFPAKGAAFNEQFEEFHSSYVDDAIVAGDYFALKTGYDATLKNVGRVQLDEIAVYHVQDGKVVSEQFFLLKKCMDIDRSFQIELSAAVHKVGSSMEMYFLKIPALFANQLSDGKRVRLVCTLAGKIRYQCSLMSASDGDYYIMLNKKNRLALGLKEGNCVETCLEIDQSKYGLDMPEELAEMLIQEPEGDRIFHQLTAGRQRSFIYWVLSAKSPEKRLERALSVVEKLQQHGVKLTGNQLLNKEE